MTYRYSKAVHDHFVSEEGFKTKSYLDTEGYWTIGIGHMLGKEAKYEGIVWTVEKCWLMLEKDIDDAAELCYDIFPEYNILPPNVQLALLDMCYNMGNRFRQFKQTIRLVHKGQYLAAANSASQSLWARQVPNRARRVCKLLSNV